jgi:hypothetical protein
MVVTAGGAGAEGAFTTRGREASEAVVASSGLHAARTKTMGANVGPSPRPRRATCMCAFVAHGEPLGPVSFEGRTPASRSEAVREARQGEASATKETKERTGHAVPHKTRLGTGV